MFATTTRTERISHWRKEGVEVAKQRRVQMQRAKSYPCQDWAACTTAMTSLPEPTPDLRELRSPSIAGKYCVGRPQSASAPASLPSRFRRAGSPNGDPL